MTEKLKVLIIDDSTTARISIKRILNQYTKDIILSENGLLAVSAAINERPHLILLDLFMPMWDGLMTLAILKRHEVTKDIPIVILSGHEKKSDKIRATALGASEFIQKPCSDDDIKQILRTYTNQEKA